jgi:hypothetical protein
MHLAICAIFRNEAPYLREWIEFHRLVGVKRFHLYQNRSEDDWQSVLQPYIQEGLVEITDWPRRPPCHIEAYQDFINAHRGKPWWVAFLDCDEFLFSPSHATVGEAIEAIALPEWGAIGVNWMFFGASGQEEPTPGAVIERFTLRAADDFPPNRHIKSIVRMDGAQSAGPNTHQFKTSGGTFSELGHRLTGPFTAAPTHTRLRINHYHTKSRQEYLRRIAGGNADGAPSRKPSEFDAYQAADVDDRTVWRFLPAVKKRLEGCHSAQPEVAPSPQSPYALYSPLEASAPRALPRELAAFRDYHEGETMLVCGCSTSLPAVISPERFLTIGVNDVGRLFDPDYLVVINPRSQFSGDRFRYVEASQAQAIFTQLDLGIAHPNIVRFQLGKRGGTDISDAHSLPYTRNSPYVALCLALHMGAKRIGLIGVDFTEHHFFAPTGRHPLAGEVNQINNEYAALAQTCRQRGVEVFNLSAESRLTAFPKLSLEQFARTSLVSAAAASRVSGKKVFFVNYHFLSCGDVFSDGLRNAAEDLGIEPGSAQWDDAALPARLAEFAPDLLFTVHGRNYSRRWKGSLHAGRRSAVWLLDEPYEVDDTSGYAQIFDTSFISDPSTVHRHKNAHFLPVCYDPATYHYRPGPRQHRVGFVGGGNPAREPMLEELARRGLLSYAIGGPWRSPEVRRLAASQNIPAAETAKLYQQTRIVVNIFRTVHHFNRDKIAAVSMNPRIYEALACGALVVSERRPEIAQLCPELPVFDGTEEMVSVIDGLLADPLRFAAIRKACIRRLAGHTYAHRLYTAFIESTNDRSAHKWVASSAIAFPAAAPAQSAPQPGAAVWQRTGPDLVGWEIDSACVETGAGGLILRALRPTAPGSEAGLSGTEKLDSVCLSFELQIERGSTFVAKIHQAEQRNQTSNSYHLMLNGKNAYVARHNHVFQSFMVQENAWHAVRMAWNSGRLRVEVDGRVECQVQDNLLASGYCFLGIKSGSATVRNVEGGVPAPGEWAAAAAPRQEDPERNCSYDLLFDSGSDSGSEAGAVVEPKVSIVTTIFDRVSCLEACLRSVRELTFESYEHIVVADAPPSPVLAQIRALAEANYDGRHRLRLATLRSRTNNWGIGPAAAGLSLAAGQYVCFLSDDNGYMPEHFEKLAAALDHDPTLGFVYSGCLYDGRVTLNSAPPALGRIDLGQPLFRRELFARHFGGTLPFRELAWDWKMIQHFLLHSVRWKHVADPTFIFRLAKYPHLRPAARQKQLTGLPD